ncbi:hypothetical protein [Amycolatopsis sp.]|uniref:hypothetical protein n=1 Tax=Amycolatopsis sp. TaxID=37632 RepID=UPI002D7ED440|nr:hypothetical protein [Amycolatopsis sp.]HET6709125.1 hypothetical protein [Amycolatopsis sp.]
MNLVETAAAKLFAEGPAVQPLEVVDAKSPVSCATFDIYRIGWAALRAAEAAGDHAAANRAAAALMRAHGFGGYDDVAGLPAQGAVSFGELSTTDLIALRASFA